MPEEHSDINDTMDLIELLEEKQDRLSRELEELTKERVMIQAELEEYRGESIEIPNGFGIPD